MSEPVELLVGKVGRAHGIRGDLTVDVRTDEPDRRFAPGTVFSTRRGPLTVESTKWHSNRLLIRFVEVPDRSVAETLRGTELHVEVDPGERPADPDEFYDHQLVGLRALGGDGAEIGVVSDVVHLPAQDLLVVRRADRPGQAGEVMVPFVSEFVPTVDVLSGELVVTDTAGLLDEEPEDTEGS